MLAFARVAARDLARPEAAGTPAARVEAAAGWLARAQDRTGEGGVSYGYSLRGGWRPAYPEVSGYVSVTFFDLAARPGGEAFRARALAASRWLGRVQNPDGSIANPAYGPDGIVFDTGQVLQGWLRAFVETGQPSFLEAARRAAGWLVAVAEPGGRWLRCFNGIPHSYNARTAWALLALDAVSPDPRARAVAHANLDWAVSQQNPAGWFEACAFRAGVAPFTHTIGYVLEGLLEAGRLAAEPRYLEAARRGAEALLPLVGPDGFLPGRIDTAGRPRAAYSCLTGSCQLAIVWARLCRQSGDERFRGAAIRALRHVAATQDLTTDDPDVRGGIKGSQPVWGGYAPFTYPSWAAKFFIDALLAGGDWL